MRNDLSIIFEDDDMLVVDKPAGITVIPDRIHTERTTLQNMLEKKFGRVFVVHRLDRETSGLICFARNEAAHRALSMQFESHEVQKFYQAIVQGIVAETKGEIAAPIAPNPSRVGTMILHKRGKEALTLYQVKEQFKHAALLEVEIKTGRTHQIRLHMASIHHPLLVDSVYGNQEEFLFSSIKRNYKASGELERPTISRLTLHSWRLALKHPASGKEMQFECDLPKDMQTLLKLLRKYDK